MRCTEPPPCAVVSVRRIFARWIRCQRPLPAAVGELVVGYLMRASILIMAVLLTALVITACASRNQSQRLLEDESLRRKLVGEWQGTLAISTNEVASFKSVIRSDGSFSAQNNIYDTSSHLLRAAQWGGTFVLTNR